MNTLLLRYSFAPTDWYSDWDWLVDPVSIKPLAMSRFGDLFYTVYNDDKEVYMLDTLEGSIVPFAASTEEFEHKLVKEDVQQEYLMAALVQTLEEKHLALKENELYMFKIHPALGGQATSDNVGVMSARPALSLLGQLHRQIQ